MQHYAAVMAMEVERFSESLGEAGEIDLLPAMHELTSYISGSCLIGHEFRSRLSREILNLYRDLDGGLNTIAMVMPHCPTPTNLRRDRARRRLVELIAPMLAERRRTPSSSDDFLDTLIDARYNDGSMLDDGSIVGMLLMAHFAGQATSAIMAAWTAIFLMQHRQEYETVRREAQQMMGSGPVTLEGLKKMQYLEYCLKETERLRPPIIILMRTVLRELQVGASMVPAGDMVLVSAAISHRLESVFAEPERFEPARFAPGREEDGRTPYALIGFGGGRHRCLGYAFAHQQVKVIWGLLLQRFVFQLIDPDPQPDYKRMVVGPQSPCRVRYRRVAGPGV
jgi:sterol 14-demethylase